MSETSITPTPEDGSTEPKFTAAVGDSTQKIADQFTQYQKEIAVLQFELQIYKGCFYDHPLPIICLDPKDKTIALWNTAAARKFGYSEESALGKGMDLIFPDELPSMQDLDPSVDALNNMGASLRTKRLLTARSRDGKDIPIDIYAFSLGNGDGRLIGRAIIDVSKEVDLLRKIKRNNESLRQLNETSEKNNEILLKFNNELMESRQATEYKMARARSQDRITNRLMLFIVSIIAVTLFLSAFVRIPETILSFVKDSSLLLLGILSGAIGGIFGSKTDEKTGVSTPLYQGPTIPQVGTTSATAQSPYTDSAASYQNTSIYPSQSAIAPVATPTVTPVASPPTISESEYY
jgi:PAS domain S-box-containing protein